MTKSSVNFKALKSALHAVSHATRTVEPSYLLAKDKSMGTIVLLDDKGSVASTLEAKLALASRQALREKNYSPVWEGILNLPRPEVGFDAAGYKNTCSVIVSSWCERYEASTGHKVLRADIHLDEGHMVDGESLLNAHAHIISDRTNDKGRVMQLSPKMLRELQTLTAEVTGLERGKSSLETGRKHISHQAYKYLAELGRLETQKQVDVQKSTTKMYGGLVDSLTSRSNDQVQQLKAAKTKTENLQAKFDGEPARLNAALKAQEAQLNEQYRADREALKTGAEKAKQADYQALKKAHAEQLEALKTKLAKAETEAAKVPDLVDLVKAKDDEIVRVKTRAVEIIGPLREEVKTLKTQITQLTDEKAQLAKDLADPAPRTSQSNPLTPAPMPAVAPLGPNARAKLRAEQMALEATKRAQEPPKQPELPTPSPAPVKSLVERLSESMKAMLDWIRSIGAGQEPVTANSRHEGPVKHIDHLHCIQKTARNSYAIHQLSHLDNIPALDDPKMQIKYLNGVGQVVGKLGQTPER